MRPNSRALAMRDPALAALVGAVGSPGADFGSEGFEFGWESSDANDVYGFEFGADAAPLPAVPTKNQAMVAWSKMRQLQGKAQARANLIEPNKGSPIKVERYSFAVNATITALATAQALNGSNNPDVCIRPQRVTCNAPSPGFVTLSEIKVSNVSVLVGGTHDAFDYASLGHDSALDIPTLSPANRASFLGNYTGLVPSPLTGTGAYTFCMSLKGWAQIVA